MLLQLDAKERDRAVWTNGLESLTLPVVGIPEHPFEFTGAFERESEHVGMADELEVASGPGIGVLTQNVLKEERVPGSAQMAFMHQKPSRGKNQDKEQGKDQAARESRIAG